MTILAFPAVRGPSLATLGLQGLTQAQVSPFDGSVQTIYSPGAHWRASLTWRNAPIDQWRPLAAFLASLHGRAGRFTYSHPMTWRRASATAGTPLVNGADQSGQTLVTDGWTNSALVLLAGDYISFPDANSRPRLHQITANVTASGAGAATLPITPPLRSSPANNAAITVAAPEAVWMLTSDDAGQVTMTGGNNNRADIQIEIMEALYGEAFPGTFTLGSSALG